jgi:glycosyltransferase involved in cell wall biosynthesis
MRVVYIAAKVLVLGGEAASPEAVETIVRRQSENPGQVSSSANMIAALQQAGIVSQSETWRLWRRPSRAFGRPGGRTWRVFQLEDDGTSPDLAAHVRANGQPDVIWMEGRSLQPELAHVYDLCPRSFKVIYPQDWRPWRAEGLDRYDLCLLDDEPQAARMRRHHPDLRCDVWDKFIDSERGHHPLGCEKEYDLCYVSFPSVRKNHDLLFRAMAKLAARDLSCVCVGGRRGDNSEALRELAERLGVRVDFTGEASKAEVNAYVNKSRIGVIASKRDSAPRAMLEYMAAGVPVLVNAELRAGLRYVGPKAGLVCPPAEFARGIAEMLDNLSSYTPRAHFLEHYSRERVVAKFAGILQRAGLSANQVA